MTDEHAQNRVSYTTREMFDEIRRDLAAIRSEIRDNRHTFAATVRGIELRVINLETFQTRAGEKFRWYDALVADAVPKLDQLLSEDTLSKRMKSAGWTRRERLMAYGLFAFAAVGALGTVLSVAVLVQ